MHGYGCNTQLGILTQKEETQGQSLRQSHQSHYQVQWFSGWTHRIQPIALLMAKIYYSERIHKVSRRKDAQDDTWRETDTCFRESFPSVVTQDMLHSSGNRCTVWSTRTLVYQDTRLPRRPGFLLGGQSHRHPCLNTYPNSSTVNHS